MRKQIFIWVIITLVASFVLNILAGRFVTAYISTWGFVRHWNLLSPQSPIVINNREEVRISWSEEFQNTSLEVKNKIGSIFMLNNGELSETGNAFVVTDNGVMLSVKSAFPVQGVAYSLKLASGEMIPIEQLIVNSQTDLVFLKIKKSGLAVMSFASTSDLIAGGNVMLIRPGSFKDFYRVELVTVNRLPEDILREIKFTDNPDKTIELSGTVNLISGHGAFNSKSELVGVWNGSTFFASSYIKTIVDNFLINKEQILLPKIGFTYKYVLPNEDMVLKNRTGIRVLKPDKNFGLPSQKAGLLAGDIIYKIDNQNIDKTFLAETAWLELIPGKTLVLSVLRGKEEKTLTLKPDF